MPKQPSAYPECRRILPTGCKCHAPALTGRPFCYHHAGERKIAGRNQRSTHPVELPPFEDHTSILIALRQVVSAVTHGRITDEAASRLYYAIQLAQNSINRLKERDGHRLYPRPLRRHRNPRGTQLRARR